MRLRAVALAATFGATVGLSACSGGPGAGGGATPAPAPTDVSSAATPGPEQSSAGPESPSAVATVPASRCLAGRYALVRFVAVGGTTYGTGQGGDVTVTFADGRYTLSGAGQKPVVVTLGGQTGNLTVDGESKGTYTLKGDAATFTARSADGTGTLDDGSGGSAQKLTMKQVDSVIGLAGRGQVACTAQAMTITLKAIRLELGRV